MMTFEKRQRAFEAKFALDNENRFKTEMRAYSKMAHYIATDVLNLSEKSSKKYSDKIISLKIQNCDRHAVFDFIQGKLKRHKVDLSHQDLEVIYLKSMSSVSH